MVHSITSLYTTAIIREKKCSVSKIMPFKCRVSKVNIKIKQAFQIARILKMARSLTNLMFRKFLLKEDEGSEYLNFYQTQTKALR